MFMPYHNLHAIDMNRSHLFSNPCKNEIYAFLVIPLSHGIALKRVGCMAESKK